MTKTLIQQQVYTREQKGVFSDTEGYDTIAVSSHLEERFIRKYVHPICVYHRPNEISLSGEKEKAFYPPSLTIIQPETGELIIGQAVYHATDSHKQRGTFFMHNYIVPKELKEKWVKNPSQLFQLKTFFTSYDMEKGQPLKELAYVEHKKENIFAKRAELFHVLSIDEPFFKQLLYAVMSAISEKKKVYISLSVSLREHHRYASLLMELLFTYLPYEMRRVLGVVTFQNEPENKKYIHVMFVESGSIRFTNKAVEKQITVDFTNRKIKGLASNVQEQPYGDFVYSALQTATNCDMFYIFCERALAGFSVEEKLQMERYQELTILFTCISNEHYMYERDRLELLALISFYLEKEHRNKLPLINLFLSILQIEDRIKDDQMVVSYLEKVLAIQNVVQEVEVIEFIVKSLSYFNGEPICPILWELVEAYPEIYGNVVSYIGDIFAYGEVVEAYLQDKFSSTYSFEQITNHMEELLQVHSSFEHHASFLKIVKKRLVEEVRKSNRPMNVAFSIHSLLAQTRNYYSLKRAFMPEVRSSALSALQLEKTTLEDVSCFQTIFLQEKEKNSFPLSGWEKEKYEVLELLNAYFNETVEQFATLNRLIPPSTSVKVNHFAQQLVKDNGLLQPFDRLILLFPHEFDGTSYREVFSYVSLVGTEGEMLAFIEWSYEKFQSNSRYVRALKEYLIHDRNSLWKDKRMKKRLEQFRSQSFKKLLKEVANQTASPSIRFLRKFGIPLVIVLLLMSGGVFYLTLL